MSIEIINQHFVIKYLCVQGSQFKPVTSKSLAVERSIGKVNAGYEMQLSLLSLN